MRRAALIILAILVALPIAAVLAWNAWFDPDALKLRAADAVRRATGRELTIAGPVGLAWSLTPTLRLADVSLANPPGFSRPALLHVAAIEARVALWPLLSRRVEVRDVLIQQPDLLLERDPAGRPNWQFIPPQPAPSPQGAATASQSRPMAITLDGVRLQDGRIGWRTSAQTIELRIPTLMAEGADPVRIAGELELNGLRLAVQGDAGPLLAPGPRPVHLALDGPGVAATANGVLGQQLDLSGTVPDLSTLSAAAGRALPPVRDIALTARLGAAGLLGFGIQTGAADLAAIRPGLSLARMTVAAPDLQEPVRFAAEGAYAGQAVLAGGGTGTLASLLQGGPIPLQLTASWAGSTLSVQGSMQDASGAGADVTVAAGITDLQAFGAALPPIRGITVGARLSAAPNGGLAVRGLRITAPPGDVAGDIVLTRLPRPGIRGSLLSQRLDLDAWPAATPAPAAPAGQTAPASPAAPAGTAAPPDPRLIPDRPLPFAALRLADADLRLAVNEAVWRGTVYRGAEARLRIEDGALRLDPLRMQTPGGAIQAQLTANAASVPPTAALTLQAPGLAAAPVLAALGAPEGTAGTIDLDVVLRGAGATTRAFAATLDGHVGAAMVEGELDNRWLASLFGEALRGASVPIDLGGRSRVRCFASRTDMAAGHATVRALTLDTSRLQLDGEGTVDLTTEAIDLRLRPVLRVGGAGVAAPLKVSGTLRAPRTALESPGQAGRMSIVIGGGPPAADPCGPALLLARDGRSGPAPADAPPPRAPKPADLLRSLIR